MPKLDLCEGQIMGKNADRDYQHVKKRIKQCNTQKSEYKLLKKIIEMKKIKNHNTEKPKNVILFMVFKFPR